MFSTRITLALGLLFLASCRPKRDGEPRSSAQAEPQSVQTVEVAESAWPETFEAPGTIRARTSTAISSRVMSTVAEVKVREGDRVAAGQLLVRLEAREFESARRQAQANVEEARHRIPESDAALRGSSAQLALAESTQRRMETLFEKKSISPQERDEAAARVLVARSAVEMATAQRRQLDERIRQGEEAVASTQVQIGYLEIRSPFTGLVTKRLAEPGILAVPGSPLLELDQEGALRLEVSVPETYLGKIERGQTAEVRSESSDPPQLGTVEEIMPLVETAARTFLVKIRLPRQAGLRSGMFARAQFGLGSRQVLTVPAQAVREQGQLRLVFAVANGVARARMVRLGVSRNGVFEVLSGLMAGDRVVTPVPLDLADGTPVQQGGGR